MTTDDRQPRQLIQTTAVAGRAIRNGVKMSCPTCGEFLTEVVAGFPSITHDSYQRRRRCLACGAMFRTEERAVVDAANGQDRDGR
jgi:predicted RNA-binding Zn-ribbon protein involved in translation (DUF1610 family)